MHAFRFDFFNNPTDQNQTTIASPNNDTQIETIAPEAKKNGKLDKETLLEKYSSTERKLSFDEHTLVNGIKVWTRNGGDLSVNDKLAKYTDLVPKIYEGGFKIWECSFDAIYSLNKLTEAPEELLDLGCGSGIVGIWVLKRWTSTNVTFHDLNDSVIEKSTLPNVLRNGDSLIKRSSFHFGPWETGSELKKDFFDVVITADTLYSEYSHEHLQNLLLHVLKPTGVAFIAAKRFYFGVGGGVASFRQLTSNIGKAETEIIASYEDGASNIRDVIEFRKKL